MTTKTKNKGLGRGLDAIFDIQGTTPITPRNTVSNMEEIDIALISPNPKQPRTRFDEDSLEELANSIRVLGVIQPITVMPAGDGRYTIISGERRWRASQLANRETIPAYIREANDQTLHEMALVENIQRQDLNAIDVALSLQRLIEECDLTQDTLASRVGKKRSTVANYMRLLKMPVEVQYAVRDELISMGHAKAIASAPEDLQLRMLKRIIRKNLSVRQAEEYVKRLSAENKGDMEAGDEEYPDSYTRLVEELEKFFSQDISIRRAAKGGGKITIDFSSDADIEGFLRKFEELG